MKTIKWAGIISIVLLSSVFGQSTAKIESSLNQSNKFSANINVSITPDNTLQNGFFIELPAGLLTVVKSIKKNSKDVWLKEGTESVSDDNRVNWTGSNKGLFIQYNSNFIADGNKIEFVLISDNKKLFKFSEFDIKVLPLRLNNQALEVVEETFATSTLKIKNTQADEE